jgi:hypothetical protein
MHGPGLAVANYRYSVADQKPGHTAIPAVLTTCAPKSSPGTYSDGLVTVWDDVWAWARSGRCSQVIGAGDAEFPA